MAQLGRISVVANGTNAANGTIGPIRVREGGNVVAAQVVVEAATGGTQTATFKWQGSLDGTNFYDLAYITDSSDTLATTAITKTATGPFVCFLDNSMVRNYNYIQLVVSSVTATITYHADLYVTGGPVG